MHHFDLHYDIVRMRHDELVQRATSLPGRGKEPRRGWFGAPPPEGRPAGPVVGAANAVVSSPCLLPGTRPPGTTRRLPETHR